MDLLNSLALHPARNTALDPAGPFSLPRLGAPPSALTLLDPLWLAAERLLGLSALNRLYDDATARAEGHVVDRMLGALGVSIESEELYIGEFQQMCSLSTWGRASIQHSHALTQIQQRSGVLCRQILH